MEAGERSPGYLRELERYAELEGHIGGFWIGRTIHEINAGTVQDWDEWLRARPIGAKTRRNVLGAFHAFCSWLELRDEIAKVPRMPSVAMDEHAPTILPVEVQARVLEAVPEPKRGAFLAMAHGIRPGEVRALNVSDYRDGWISVSKAYKGPNLDSPIRGTKGRRARRVPCDEGLREWLEKSSPARAAAVLGQQRAGEGARVATYDSAAGSQGADPPAVPHLEVQTIQPAAPLFPNPTARNPEKRWIHQALREEWHRACKRVGITGVQMYEGTKHSTATDAIRRGVPVELVRRFLGHADIRTTQRYVNLEDTALVHVLRRKEQ
jgi:integrase